MSEFQVATEEDRPRSRWVLLAVAALLVALAVGWLVSRSGDGDGATPPDDVEVVLPTATDDPSEEEPTSDPDPDDGPVDGGEPGSAAARLDEIGFQRVVGVRIPTHPTAGPTVQSDGLASGWERSELGAVLAAFGISIRSIEEVGPAVFRPTILEHHTGDPSDVEASLALAERSYENERFAQGAEEGAPLADPLFQYLGWVVDFYDGDRAEVRLLGRGAGPEGQALEATFRTPLVWEDGDWRYVAAPGGVLNARISNTFDRELFTLFEVLG